MQKYRVMAAASKRKNRCNGITIRWCRRTDFSDYRHWKTGRMAGKEFYSFTLPMVMPDTKYLCRKG